MIYKYDNQSLTFKNITKHIVGICIGVSIVLSLFMSLFLVKRLTDVKYISEETKAIIINENTKANEFSPEKLRTYILELNIRFPHIVYAQARLESGNFKSDIFKTNNNLFGMKIATKRPSTNKGEESGHAYYNTWKESVEDYAMFQAAYLNNIKTEADYFEYLTQNYSESPEYLVKLKEIIAENNVMFDKK